MTPPQTVPSSLTMSVTESFDLLFNTSKNLKSCRGTAPSSPSSTLVNIGTNATIDLVDDPIIAEKNIIQRIVGSTDLSTPGRYRLTVNFTALPTDNVFAMELMIIAIP